jgi:hypothetical protein
MSLTASQYGVIAVLIAAAVTLVVRYERLCLQELAATPDNHLLHLSRQGWLVAIVFFIPLGGMAFLCVGRIR